MIWVDTVTNKKKTKEELIEKLNLKELLLDSLRQNIAMSIYSTLFGLVVFCVAIITVVIFYPDLSLIIGLIGLIYVFIAYFITKHNTDKIIKIHDALIILDEEQPRKSKRKRIKGVVK